MDLQLKGKRALVTGGSRGIGSAIVKQLAAEGVNIVFTYVSKPDHAEETLKEAHFKGVKAFALHADSTNPDEVTGVVNRTVEELGGIDILVNNAGILKAGIVDELTLDDFDKIFAVNVRSTFVAIQETIKHMKKGGRIINIGSNVADHFPFPGCSIYIMTKTALHGLTRGLARDLGPRGITVNTIQPGPIETDMNPSNTDFSKEIIKQTALGRYGETKEVGQLAAFLASPLSSFITGASFTIDGGCNA